MKPNKIIATLLIIASCYLGYQGFQKVQQSGKNLEVLNLELKLSNNDAKQEGYLYLGIAAVVFAGGIFMLKK